MPMMATGLSLHRQQRALLQEVSLTLHPGQLHVLLGANGAGKSTLLKIFSGEWRADSGKVTLDEQPLQSFSTSEQARRRAVLPQQDMLDFGFTIRELVALGRSMALRGSSAYEKELIDTVMQETGTLEFSQRSYLCLSGGERRRAQLARVLAQIWDVPQAVLLLDEPTHSLDLPHQHTLMLLLRKLANKGFAILASLHDLNLTAAYAQRVSLIANGRLIASGSPEQTLTEPHLKAVYSPTLNFRAMATDAVPHWLVTPENAPQQ